MSDASWLPVSLPHGLGNNYVLPKSLGLTSLFSSYDFRRVQRPVITEPVELAAYGKTRVMQFMGYQLDQPDADVFMQLVALSMTSTPVQVGVFCLMGFTVDRGELLRLLGRDQGAGDKRWLAESLDRLVGARFRFDRPETDVDAADDYDDDTWRTGLVHEWALVGKKTIQILLNHKLARLYSDNAWSLINRQQRQALADNKMAQWLHSFYSGFQRPDPILAQALRKPLARTKMQDSKYLDALAAALAALAAATGWACQLTNGYVVVNKAKKAASTTPKAKAPLALVPPAVARSPAAPVIPVAPTELSAFIEWQSTLTVAQMRTVCGLTGTLPDGRPDTIELRAVVGTLHPHYTAAELQQMLDVEEADI